MKKSTLFLSGCAAILGAAGLYFSDDIRAFKTALDYRTMYEPNRLAESFRSMHEQLPAVIAAAPDEVYHLTENFRNDALPKTYIYEGKTKDTLNSFKETQATGVAILHKGELIYEAYFGGNTRNTRAIQHSVSKSMVSFLIGVAYEEGDIESLDDQVIKYAPALEGSAYDGATIKNVLEMSSGVRWNEDYASVTSDISRSVVAFLSGSLDEFTASVPREFEPGTYNRYSSIDTHALSMILRGATRKSFKDYFEEKLWSRIGAEDSAALLTDTVNEPIAYGGVNIRLRDMIRFGELYLNGGVNFKGERLVSEDWVKTSTRPDVPRLLPGADNPQSNTSYGYKYQWWTPLNRDGHDFMALGIYGQIIYVNPARDIVIARTSAYQDYLVDGGYMLYESIVAFQEIAKYLSPDEKMPDVKTPNDKTNE